MYGFRWALLALLLALGFGCGSPFSNDIFEDDAAYRAALPAPEMLQVGLESAGSPRQGAECVEGGLYSITVNTIAMLNGTTDRILQVIDSIQSRPISQRGENSRVWGPYARESGVYVRLTVERRDVREEGELLERYAYWLDVMESPEGEGDAAIWGHWDPAFSLTQGVGALGIDFEIWGQISGSDEGTGTLSIGYDILDIRRIDAQFEDRKGSGESASSPSDTAILYQEDGAGGGWLSYEVVTNLTGGDGRKEQLEITSRLGADGSGRAEGWAFDGDLGLEGIYVAECWSPSGCLVFYEDSNPSQPPQGDEGRCVVQDVILPEGF